MVKLAKLPNKHAIDLMQRTVDYYVYKGIPCARRWPRHSARRPGPNEKATRETFSYIVATTKQISAPAELAYRAMAASTVYRWQDLVMALAISGSSYVRYTT